MDRSTTRRHMVKCTSFLLGIIGTAGCLEDESPEESGGDEEETSTDANAADGENMSDEGDTTDVEDEASEETDTPDEDGPQDMSFQSTNGVELMGTIYGDGECAIVLTPQINRERGSWEPQATQLADKEYITFAIDVDEDDRPASILGAVQYLQAEHEINRVILIGASIGGEASVIANAHTESDTVRGVVAISPGGGTDYAADLTGQKLFVVAEEDEERFIETTETLHETAPEPKELQIYSGDAHGQGLFETEHSDDLFQRIVNLVEEACES